MSKKNLKNVFKLFFHNEKGTTAIEYSLIASLLSIAVLAAVNSIGLSVSDLFFDKIVALL